MTIRFDDLLFRMMADAKASKLYISSNVTQFPFGQVQLDLLSLCLAIAKELTQLVLHVQFILIVKIV